MKSLTKITGALVFALALSGCFAYISGSDGTQGSPNGNGGKSSVGLPPGEGVVTQTGHVFYGSISENTETVQTGTGHVFKASFQ